MGCTICGSIASRKVEVEGKWICSARKTCNRRARKREISAPGTVPQFKGMIMCHECFEHYHPSEREGHVRTAAHKKGELLVRKIIAGGS